MQLYESGEMYLETILTLSKSMENVRSIDICRKMGFSKPSVSNAVKNLREGGFIEVSPEGFITLTEAGRQVAEKIYERHMILTEGFEMLGIPYETASEDACKIEHVISDVTFEAIKRRVRG